MFSTSKSEFVLCVMFALKYFAFVSVVFVSAISISTSEENGTAEFLWNLSNFAIQSMQYHRPYPYMYKYPGKYPPYYQNYPVNSYAQYPGSTYLNSHNQRPYHHSVKEQYPSGYRPNITPSNPYYPIGQNFKQSFIDVLLSITKNDDLQCVPKIICEMTSGTISGRQQGINLPININMDSLLGFLSTLNGFQSSPLLYFGKAALLGYTSKGNTGSCSYAYPNCPSDPDKLVQYLNNHNGGFFRYFNGIRPQHYPLKLQSQYDPLNFRQKGVAEQRIQNNPGEFVDGSFRDQKEIKFPPRYEEEIRFEDTRLKFPNEDSNLFNNEVNPNRDHFFLYKSQNLLKFPEEETTVNYEELPYRKPKELPYDLSYYYSNSNDLDFQKPLSDHQASSMIFPDRTGTGELRLDAEMPKQPLFYEDDDVKITFNKFNGGRNEDKFRFTSDEVNESNSPNYGQNGQGFSFPAR